MSTIKLTGTSSGSSIIKAPDSGSTNQTFTLPASSGTLVTTTDAGVAGITSAADATAMTITSAEKIGIGTGSPTSKLHIVDNSNYSLSVVKSGENIHMAQFKSDGTASLGIHVDDNNNLVRLNSEGSNDSLQLEVADGTVGVKIDSTGAVTMPLQPAFLAQLSGGFSLSSTNTALTIPYNTEIFDQNADFNTSTYTFTAPITGKYQFNIITRLDNVDSGATYYHIYFTTSNRTYYDIFDPRGFDQDLGYLGLTVPCLADMDANDTAIVKIYQAGGSAQTTQAGTTDSHFSGYLVC